MSDLDELAQAGEGNSIGVDLSALSALAMKQLDLEGEVDKLDTLLKAAKEKLRKIQEGDLPDALKAAMMTTFGLENGMTVSYAEDLKISIPKNKKAAVIKTMRDWGRGAAVTKLLTIDLGKGSTNENAEKSLVAQAKEMGVDATIAEDIPSGTVKAELKKRAKEGKNDNLADFGAFAFTKATVK